MKVYAIADLHTKKITKEQLATFADNFPAIGDILLIVGDTDTPDDFISEGTGTESLIIPGNSDPEEWKVNSHVNGLLRLAHVCRWKKDVTILGYMGVNWTETPWAHHHLLDCSSDVEGILAKIETHLSIEKENPVLLALHFPLSYVTDKGTTVVHPGFKDLVEKNKERIKAIVCGHVHKDCGEIGTEICGIPLYNVSADRLGFIPLEIWESK